jgi:hypothetical protein
MLNVGVIYIGYREGKTGNLYLFGNEAVGIPTKTKTKAKVQERFSSA